MGADNSKTIIQNNSTTRNAGLEQMYQNNYSSQEELDRRDRELRRRKEELDRQESENYDNFVTDQLKNAFKNRKTCANFSIDTDVPNSGSEPTKLALRRLCASDFRVSAEWTRHYDHTDFTVCFKP